jgi:hypothetical protein
MTSANTLSDRSIIELEDLISKMQTSREWMLVAPDGRVWITESVQELFTVLAPHHPLLKLTP